MTDLDPLFPPEVGITVNGETITLTAFKAKHLRAYLHATRRMQEKAAKLGRDMAVAFILMREYNEKRVLKPFTAYPDLGDIPVYCVDVPELDSDKLPLDLLHERCYEEYVELTMAATGKTHAWVEDLGIDELVTIASIVNQLNAERYSSKKPAALTEQATVQS